LYTEDCAKVAIVGAGSRCSGIVFKNPDKLAYAYYISPYNVV